MAEEKKQKKPEVSEKGSPVLKESKKTAEKVEKKPVADKKDKKASAEPIVLSTDKIGFDNVIKYPLATESAIRLVDNENTLVFIVDRNSAKSDIKAVLESMYGIRIAKVRTMITNKGKKKAYVALASDSPAIDLATKLGIM